MNDINQISIEKIKRWFEKISQGKSSYDKEGIKPSKDWDVLIAVATIIFCLEIVVALFVYFQIENNSWFQEPQNDAIIRVSLNQNLLQTVTGQIDAKNAIFSSATSTSMADPSL